jgi:hypothetical protein
MLVAFVLTEGSKLHRGERERERERDSIGNCPLLSERRSGSTSTCLTFSRLQFSLIRKWDLEIVYISVTNCEICQPFRQINRP